MIGAVNFHSWRHAGCLLALLALAGCASVVAPPPPAPATYDLGPIGARAKAGERPTLAVVMPPWLDQPVMRYRLSYADPHEVRAYTRSRWEATPGRLLAERLEQAWPGPALGSCRVVVVVDEWIHDFAAPDRSLVVLAGDVRLVAPMGRRLAERAFRREVAPPRHDASGMAAASGEAAAALLQDFSAWLAASGFAGAPACQGR